MRKVTRSSIILLAPILAVVLSFYLGFVLSLVWSQMFFGLAPLMMAIGGLGFVRDYTDLRSQCNGHGDVWSLLGAILGSTLASVVIWNGVLPFVEGVPALFWVLVIMVCTINIFMCLTVYYTEILKIRKKFGKFIII